MTIYWDRAVLPQDVDASLVLAMAVVIDEIHDEENPEAGGEALPDMLEDAKGLPLPKAPQQMSLGWAQCVEWM